MLTKLKTRLRTRLAAFRDDTDGVVTIEGVIMLPILFWAFMAMFVYFDAYRQTSISQKAAFTISDMISRETLPIDDNYIDATQNLFDFLIRSPNPTRIRITIAKFNAAANQYEVVWSKSRGEVLVMDQDTIVSLSDHLPTVPDDEQFIVVESWNDYAEPLRVGLSDEVIKTFVFARPRFAPQVKWQDPVS